MTRILFLLVVAWGLLAGPARAAERQVPFGWLGVTVDGPVRPEDGAEWRGMTGAGVESARIAVRWYELQPTADGAIDFSPFERFVAAAAAHGIGVLPVVHSAPEWASLRPGDLAAPPAENGAYGRFMTALVGRYGPDGSFWRERPDLPYTPIRAWQIWNEPNLRGFWSEQPFAPSFASALRAAAEAVHAADPGATVVLAGMPGASWVELERLYAAGARGAFDAVAIHPYTRRPRDVVRIARLTRGVMRAHGDGGLPIWVTEMSWPAAQGRGPKPVGFEVTDRGQARRLRAALRQLARTREELGIARVYWYTWLSTEQRVGIWNWSGLRRVRDGRRVSAPSLAAFRRVARRLEGCAKRPSDARACA